MVAKEELLNQDGHLSSAVMSEQSVETSIRKFHPELYSKFHKLYRHYGMLVNDVPSEPHTTMACDEAGLTEPRCPSSTASESCSEDVQCSSPKRDRLRSRRKASQPRRLCHGYIRRVRGVNSNKQHRTRHWDAMFDLHGRSPVPTVSCTVLPPAVYYQPPEHAAMSPIILTHPWNVNPNIHWPKLNPFSWSPVLASHHPALLSPYLPPLIPNNAPLPPCTASQPVLPEVDPDPMHPHRPFPIKYSSDTSVDIKPIVAEVSGLEDDSTVNSRISSATEESNTRDDSMESIPLRQTNESTNRFKNRNYKNMSRERRVEANARERTRVHTISSAFDKLRQSIPSYSNTQKLSKLSVLKIASTYILSLSRLSGHDYSEGEIAPTFSECVALTTRSLQLEGKSKKN